MMISSLFSTSTSVSRRRHPSSKRETTAFQAAPGIYSIQQEAKDHMHVLAAEYVSGNSSFLVSWPLLTGYQQP